MTGRMTLTIILSRFTWEIYYRLQYHRPNAASVVAPYYFLDAMLISPIYALLEKVAGCAI
jgi:hypothetical protein